jgi:hypothetical protein
MVHFSTFTSTTTSNTKMTPITDISNTISNTHSNTHSNSPAPQHSNHYCRCTLIRPESCRSRRKTICNCLAKEVVQQHQRQRQLRIIVSDDDSQDDSACSEDDECGMNIVGPKVTTNADDVEMVMLQEDNNNKMNIGNFSCWNVIDLTVDDMEADNDVSMTTMTIMSASQSQGLRVSFGSVFTREYSVTVGDHPCTTDSVGLSLDWGHSEEREDALSVSGGRRRGHASMRRLTAAERRERICTVTGCLPSHVRAAEYNMALQRYNQELEYQHHVHVQSQEQVNPQQQQEDSARLLHYQHILQVLYNSFQDVEQRQEKEHQYMQRHRRHQHKRSHAPESNRVAAPAC